MLGLIIFLAMWWRTYWNSMYRSTTLPTISSNYNTIPTDVVPSLIVPSVSRIDGSMYEKYSANYGVFCPLMNLTKFNRHVNFAYISDYAAPDHRFSLPSIPK